MQSMLLLEAGPPPAKKILLNMTRMSERWLALRIIFFALLGFNVPAVVNRPPCATTR